VKENPENRCDDEAQKEPADNSSMNSGFTVAVRSALGPHQLQQGRTTDETDISAIRAAGVIALRNFRGLRHRGEARGSAAGRISLSALHFILPLGADRRSKPEAEDDHCHPDIGLLEVGHHREVFGLPREGEGSGVSCQQEEQAA
jgi:hypothetical protein